MQLSVIQFTIKTFHTIEHQQAKIYSHKNTWLNLPKTNAASWFIIAYVKY